MTAVEHRVCRTRTAEERKAVAEAARRRAVRYPIPRRGSPDFVAQVSTIQAAIAPLMDWKKATAVMVTYWQGAAVYDRRIGTAWLVLPWDWPFGADVESVTHLSIHGIG